MKTITKTYEVYSYDELDEKAKQKAIEWFAEGYPEYEWWGSTYEDARKIGLIITEFDTHRNRNAKGKFDGLNPEECARNITENQGADCSTYKTAKAFLMSMDSLNTEYSTDANGQHDVSDIDGRDNYEDEKEELETEFLKSLLEDYAMILQKELEYLESEAHIVEMIEANDYEFTKEGKRFVV